MQLSQATDAGDDLGTVPYLCVHVQDTVRLAEMENLALWLLARAAEYREAIDGPEAALAASKRLAADAVRPFMPGLARELDAEAVA